jgi:hypothetical protein
MRRFAGQARVHSKARRLSTPSPYSGRSRLNSLDLFLSAAARGKTAGTNRPAGNDENPSEQLQPHV